LFPIQARIDAIGETCSAQRASLPEQSCGEDWSATPAVEAELNAPIEELLALELLNDSSLHPYHKKQAPRLREAVGCDRLQSQNQRLIQEIPASVGRQTFCILWL
jgi:hypothetical protein